MVELVEKSLEKYEIGRVRFWEHYTDVRPEEMDSIRQIAARNALGRELTTKELETIAEVIRRGSTPGY